MIQFEKWQGLGNDFIVIDQLLSDADARRLCDRRRGIGADGVLCVLRTEEGAVRMVVLNADGSRPEMCGNGLRCVAGYTAEQHKRDVGELVVMTDAGPRRCDFQRQADGVFSVTAAMGCAKLGEGIEHAGPTGERSFVQIDVGNPHAVSFEPFDDNVVDTVGPAVERAVAGRTNVEFARLFDEGKRIEVVVWERGVGRTEACGTGACAVAVAAVAAGHAQAGEPIVVILPGGELSVMVQGDNYELSMTGPACRTFVGQVAV